MTEKYDKIGKNYNLTRKADPYLVSRLQDLLSPENDATYLDIGCGTGNYTIELAKKGFNFIGVDPSVKMLNKAREKNNKIEWLQGTAENIPLDKNSVDGIIGSLTIHHWSDLEKGFKALNYVLKPKGKFVLFTATPQQMTGYWLNHYFPKMLQDSMNQMPALELVENRLDAAGFKIIQREKYFIAPDLQDLFLYAGKHDPTMYLDPQIRQGISSFSSLANEEEVNQGLILLEKDIESGKVKDIINGYQNDMGDYLYLVSEKAGAIS